MNAHIAPFAAPIAHQIWDKKYRLKTIEGHPIDNSVFDTWRRIAKALSLAEEPEARQAWEDTFYSALKDFWFLPAGRIVAGAGSGRNVTLSNCFTMGTIPDSMDGIFSHLKEAALTMQQGGGIGYDFSTIRPKGADVLGVAADASGPLSFMDVWDAMCRTILSAGARRGAMMATMRCDHPDILDFITVKHDAARMRMFNLSVLATDDFMEAVKTGDYETLNWPLVFTGKDGLERVYNTVNAAQLWDTIMQSNYDSAEPGVIFIDRVNRDHNIGYLETIATTNPCGEKPMGPYASCLLGSLNLARLVVNAFTQGAKLDRKKLREIVRIAIRMMDNVVDVGGFPLPAQLEKAKQDRQLGLGVTGLGDALAMLGITYGSNAAANMTEEILREIAIAAYKESINLAKEKGAFPTFDADDYLDPESYAGRQLPSDIQDDIRQHGIRNALLISIAPTGTISLYAGNISSGVEPIFAHSYTRKILNDDGTHRTELVEDYAVAAYREHWLAENGEKGFGHDEDGRIVNGADVVAKQGIGDFLPDQFVNAQTLTPTDHIRMQAAAQKWVDSSISKTTNCPKDISFEDFKAIYMLAWDMGCKGCTTYRPNDITGSILSVEPEPEATHVDVPIESLMDSAKAYLEGASGYDAKEYRKDRLKDKLAELGVAKVKDLTGDDILTLWHWLIGQMQNPEGWGTLTVIDGDGHPVYAHEQIANVDVEDTVDGTTHMTVLTTAPTMPTDEDIDRVLRSKEKTQRHIATGMKGGLLGGDFSDIEARVYAQMHQPEEPQARPEELPGVVYKLKFGDMEHAVYVTITDIVDDAGNRRPFEIFFNTKAVDHTAWMTAMARMISAIFRRPHDSRFIAQELKEVHDPTGGAWMPGGYVPSIHAAIGGIIERHMDAIGYTGANRVKTDLKVAPQPAMDKLARIQKAVVDIRDQMTASSITGRVTPPKGRPCASCGSYNMRNDGGCPTCLNCGWSKCS